MFRGPFLIDAHVHLYGCYDEDRFFDGALTNFTVAKATLGVKPDVAGWLLFTETSTDHAFRALRARSRGGDAGAWTFQPTREDCSLLACRGGKIEIVLVAGRQITTREGLEVLALGCDREFPDGKDTRETIDAVLASNAVAVLPWGFGKWWFARGRLVSKIIRSCEHENVYLGDNSGRPRAFPRPRLFDVAEKRNIRVLPGTDPLPFTWEAERAGRYGFVLEGDVESERPMAGLKRLLRNLESQPRIYGSMETLGRFCRHQMLMQIRKRRRRSLR